MSDYKVITISREYGAGGRSIAKAIAEKLNLPWYDRDFVKKTAEASGYSVEDIQSEGEQVGSATHFITNLLNPISYESSADGIFRAQKQVILDMAAKESCIIIGRCANVILKQAGVPAFHIFLYADMEHRMQRAAELGENGGMDLRKYVTRRDSRREAYYKTYTGHEFGDYHDYNICLDTGRLGYDKCVEIITGILQG